MLYACEYPWALKQRIASTHGHLSNEGAGKLLTKMLHGGLSHVVLAHISENSNTPEVAYATVVEQLGEEGKGVCLRCASVDAATELFEVDAVALEAVAW